MRPLSETEKPVPSPKKLKEMRLLLLEEGHCFRDQALSFCQMTDDQPRNIMEGSSLSTLVQMVGAGMGLTLISRWRCRSKPDLPRFLWRALHHLALPGRLAWCGVRRTRLLSN